MKKKIILIFMVTLIVISLILCSACSNGTYTYKGVVLGSGEIALKNFGKVVVNVDLEVFGQYSFEGKYKIGKADSNGNKKVTITYKNENGEDVAFVPMYIDSDGNLRVENSIIKFEKK